MRLRDQKWGWTKLALAIVVTVPALIAYRSIAEDYRSLVVVAYVVAVMLIFGLPDDEES